MELAIDGQTIEVTTEQEAIKAVRRAARDKRKKEKSDEAKRRIAMSRAQNVGYGLYLQLHRHAEEKTDGEFKFPRGLRFIAPNVKHKSFDVKATEHHGRYPEITWHHGGDMAAESESGTAVTDHYGLRFLGAIENGAGWPVVAVFQDDKFDRDPMLYALGFEGDAHYFASLPGITLAMFCESSNNGQED